MIMALAAAPTFAGAQAVTAKPGATAPAVVSTAPAQSNGPSEADPLNDEQAARARAQNEANAQSEAEFARRMAEYRAAVAQAAADRERHAAEVAEAQRKQAEYETAFARWQSDVAACNAGDFARCQSSAPAPR